MCLKTTEVVDNEIDDTEKRFVSEFRQVCNQNGREINPEKSAPILYQLGKVYYIKAKQGPDLICLIQSAALYNAAIARSTKVTQKVEEDLHQLCRYVLDQSGARNKNADLINYAKHVKNEFTNLRENVKQKLKSIPQIPNDAATDKLANFEKQKIVLIRDLHNYITNRYTKIMADVAEYCHDIMGDAPCRFAIIGMGSLARKEITPFSDFEHIITLEDEVVNKCANNNFEKIVISYFKWFSVVFHIIVINLQETILPSVAIPSLNDFYSENKKDNWFFDALTPRGVSFDGLMPHACKLPIGRQKSTKLKPWKTELIKPISCMLQYLTEDSQLKNGYHLKDILTKTCFVYGDEVIYKQFSNGVFKVICSQTDSERIESVKNQINDDLESFATKNTLFQMYMKKEIDIKRTAYRSSTLFISAMGQLFKLQKSSCFEIIETLAEMQELTEYAKHKQMFAVALACETRLRWYIENKRQTDIIVADGPDKKAINTLFSVVGNQSAKSYFQITYALQCDISKRLSLKKIRFYSNPKLLNFSIGLCLMESTQLTIPISKAEINTTKFVRLYNIDKCLEILELKDSKIDTIMNYFKAKLSSKLELLKQAGKLLTDLNCYDDASEYYQKALQIQERATTNAETEVVEWSARLARKRAFRVRCLLAPLSMMHILL